MQRLINIAENGNDKDSGMAYYFLGLYHERIAQKAKENYDHEYYVRDKKYTYQGDNIKKDIEIYLQENNIEPYDNLIKVVSKLDDLYRWLSNKNENEQAKKVENFIVYLYNKNYNILSKMEQENFNLATKYFELAVSKGFHIAIAHIAKKIIEKHSK